MLYGEILRLGQAGSIPTQSAGTRVTGTTREAKRQRREDAEERRFFPRLLTPESRPLPPVFSGLDWFHFAIVFTRFG